MKNLPLSCRSPLPAPFQHSFRSFFRSDQREKERDLRLQELRQQRDERVQKNRPGAGEVVMKKIEKSADGSTVSEITKTNRFAQSGARVHLRNYSWLQKCKSLSFIRYLCCSWANLVEIIQASFLTERLYKMFFGSGEKNHRWESRNKIMFDV